MKPYTASFSFRGRLRAGRFLLAFAFALGALASLSASSSSAATTRPSEVPITETQPGEPLSSPFGLAIDGSDNLWISDIGTGKLSELDSGGALVNPQNPGAGAWEGSGQIKGVAFAEAAGEMYVADSNLDDLWGVNVADATVSTAHYFGGPWDPTHTGCCFIRDAVDNSGGVTGGDIYVSNGSTVSRIEPTGPTTFAPSNFAEGPGELTGPFGSPLSLATDAAGNLYVGAANGVFVFEPSGKVLHEFVQAGGSAIGSIEAIAVDPISGNILAAGEKAIFELSPAGALEAKVIEANGAAFGAIQGLAVDSTGKLYVADGSNHQVDVFGPAEALPPESDGGSATEISTTAAKLLGSVNPNGHPTTYQFRYGTFDCSVEPSPCTPVPVARAPIGSGKVPISVSQLLTGLEPNTTYHYQLIVEDTEGERIAGPDRTFATQGRAASALPDGRQWQLVSPAEKHGSSIYPIEEIGVVQAAASGAALTYRANAPIGTDPVGYSNGGVQIISARDRDGWQAAELNVPHERPPGQAVGPGYEPRMFSDDLSVAFIQPFGDFTPIISPLASEATAFLHSDFPAGKPSDFCSSECFQPLVTGASALANVPPGTAFGQPPDGLTCAKVTFCGPEFVDATPDGAMAVLQSSVALTEGAPDEASLYAWRGDLPAAEQLVDLSVLPDGTPAQLPRVGQEGTDTRHAISADGSRVVFEAGLDRSEKALYLRDLALGETLQIDAAEPNCGSCESGGGKFQLASVDGSSILFTDTKRLAADSGADPSIANPPAALYECRVETDPQGHLACDLADLTPATGGEPAAVQGSLIGGSDDGDRTYFVANGILASNTDSDGEQAVKGDCEGGTASVRPPGELCNLYVRDGTGIHLVAVLSGGDVHDWAGLLREMPARVSPDGQWLEFMSERSLTGYDNRDLATGRPVAEVYLYGADQDRVLCVSCDPNGGRPRGTPAATIETRNGGLIGGRDLWEAAGLVSANVPGWIGFAQGGDWARRQPRYLSNAGRLFFNSLDPLAPADSNGTADVYQYEPTGIGSCEPGSASFHPAASGCVDLISSGASGQESAFLDASESGDDVFFLTSARLDPVRDTDNARDVYDAHVCVAAAPCLPVPPPAPPVCAGDACQQPAVPPAHPTPGTSLLNGPGNVLQCPKGKAKQKGKCVKKKQKKAKKHHKKGKHKKSNKKKGKNKRAAGKSQGGKR